MRIDQLEALVVISRCQSLSAASEQLHISVQALSSSIKNLENELNLSVLERNSKGVTLTRDGMAVVKVATQFMRDMSKIQSKHEDPRILALDKPITIYTHTKIYELFIPRILCTLRIQIPGIEISVHKTTQQQPLIDAVSGGETEFAFTFHNRTEEMAYRYHHDLQFTLLFECKIACLAHSDFPLSSLKTVSLKKLVQYPIIIYCTPDYQENDLMRLLNRYAKLGQLIFEEDHLVFREMIEAGVGIGFSVMTPFETYFRPFSQQVNTIMLNDKFQLYIGYLTKKDAVLSETNEVFLRYCKNYLLRNGRAYPAYLL